MPATAMKRKATPCPVKPGDKVTCRRPVEAYYSDYAGNPKVEFKPAMVGTVAAVDVPAVTVKRGEREYVFALVDFTGPEIGPPHARCSKWRVALRYDNILPVFEPGDEARIDKRYSKWRGKSGIVERVELFAEACEIHGAIFHVYVRLPDVKHGEAVEAFTLDQLTHGR
jgi:hypothetical protein